MRFKLHDIRESKAWQEAYKEGCEVGRLQERERIIRLLLAKGMTVKQIAYLLDFSVAEVRQLGNGGIDEES